MTIKEIFQYAIGQRASDVHLAAGLPTLLRIDGILKPIADLPVLTPENIQVLIFDILSPAQKEKLINEKELDFSHETPDHTRFRVNCHFEKGNLGLVARIIPAEIPTMEQVGLPPIVYEMTRKKQGLVLVTGPTGCGKSTSLAAMINLINQERPVHIVTLEDPVEFIFKPIKAVVKQREVGVDTLSFAEGLKHIVRQDPNIIMVGEMRDLETIAATLTLAETGHLVLATLHTNNTAQTIDRIIDVFPPHQQNQIKIQLSMVLNGVIAQQLMPKVGGGRIAAREIMINTPAIANLIRDNKISQIKSIVQTSANEEMVTLDQDLEKLFKQGLIIREIAEMYMVDGQLEDEGDEGRI